MNGAFEVDLVRPLGLVTLNFGYAEYELDGFLERLAVAKLLPCAWTQRPMGQKLGLLDDALNALDPSVRLGFGPLLEEVRALLLQRNALIHGCILAGGRVISSRSGVNETRVSAGELDALANDIFNWKERMWAYRWKQVEPLLPL